MASSTNRSQDVPMSVRAQRVLDSVKRMSPTEKVNLFIRAGLLPESEAQQAIDRLTLAEKSRQKPKAGAGRRTKSPKQSGD